MKYIYDTAFQLQDMGGASAAAFILFLVIMSFNRSTIQNYQNGAVGGMRDASIKAISCGISCPVDWPVRHYDFSYLSYDFRVV